MHLLNLSMRIQIRLSVDQHYGEERLFADFPYNKELISILKSIPGCRWSQSKKKWHFFPSMQAVEWLEEKTKGICLVDSSGFRQYLEQKQKKSVTNRLVILEKNTQDALMHFQRWLQQKRYSPQTINIGTPLSASCLILFCLASKSLAMSLWPASWPPAR